MTETPAHLTHPKYRPDIDGLRAIAVLSVVAFHAFPEWISGGFIGVDIFFVISGYLISTILFSSLDKNTFSFFEFYSRRIKRIFPALLIVLIATFIFGWFALLADEYKQLGKHIAGGAGFIDNFLLWKEADYFDRAGDSKPLLHLWSLGIEEQFYIVWPFLLWAAWKRKFNLLSLSLLIALVSFYLNLTGTRKDVVAAFYQPQFRFWELLSGGLLAWSALHKPSGYRGIWKKLDVWAGNIIYSVAPEPEGSTLRNLLSIFGFLLICYGVYKVNNSMAFPGSWALLPIFGAVSIIAAGPGSWLNRALLSSRLFVWVGLISFPLYLWHWPLLSFARIVQGSTPTVTIRAAAVAIAIALAWLTYFLIEKPLRFGAQGRLKTLGLAIMMLLVGAVGYGTFKADGVPGRFPKNVQEFTQYRFDYRSAFREGSCFLRPEQSYRDFDKCESPKVAGKPTVLIWGDSYAAHLYPGYNAVYGGDYNLIQRTASVCPPIPDMEIHLRPFCKEINDSTLRWIASERPERVVLAAHWTHYDWTKIEATLALLKKMGINNIDLIGDVPEWKDGLPRQLFEYFKKHVPHVIPYRMSDGLVRDLLTQDGEMKRLSEKAGVRFISMKDLLCKDNECLVRLGEAGETLTSFDTGHLTPFASQYVVAHFPK